MPLCVVKHDEMIDKIIDCPHNGYVYHVVDIYFWHGYRLNQSNSGVNN